MDAQDLRDSFEKRGFRFKTDGKEKLVITHIGQASLTPADQALVDQHVKDLHFLTQLREWQGLSCPLDRHPQSETKREGWMVKSAPLNGNGKCPVANALANGNGQGKSPVDPPIEIITPAGDAYGDRPAVALVTEAIGHLRAWLNGGTSTSRYRALAHLALSKLTAAVGKCEHAADFQISTLDTKAIMKVAEQLLVRNLVGDNTQWRPEHLERLRERLEAGDQLVDWLGPVAQPRLRKPSGEVYVLFRTDA